MTGWGSMQNILSFLFQSHCHTGPLAHQPFSFLRGPASSMITLLSDFHLPLHWLFPFSISICSEHDFHFKSQTHVSSLTMFLSPLLLFTAYLKRQSAFTAFHFNLLWKLISSLIPLKLLWQRHKWLPCCWKMKDMFQSSILLELSVMFPLLTTWIIGLPSSCGF